MKVALVTGSAGFLGRHFVSALLDRGYRVRTCDIKEGQDCLDLFVDDDYRYDLVVHCAALEPHRAAIDGKPTTFIANAHLDASLFEWAVRTGQKHLLYLSSCAVLDGPDDYGWTKLSGERLASAARRAGVPTTVVRPFSGYGEDQGEEWPFGAFVARAARREDPFVIWGNGSQVRDWVHVDDLVAGALAVVASGTDQPVNICTGRGTSMTALAQLICQEAGYRPKFEYLKDKPRGVPYRVGDPTRLWKFYTPRIPIEEGVKRAIAGR